MSISPEYGRFNIYDVVSTFLPGAVVLVGVSLPHPDAPEYFASLTLAGLFVWGTVSFAVGLVVQSLAGSLVSGEDGFTELMTRTVTKGVDDGAVSEADVWFVETVRARLEYGAAFDNWDQAYRAILTELENNPPSRAIRLQALFLATRGLVVVLAILTLTTALYTVLALIGIISPYPPAWLLAAGAVALGVATLKTYARAVEFSNDVVAYMVAEFRALDRAEDGTE